MTDLYQHQELHEDTDTADQNLDFNITIEEQNKGNSSVNDGKSSNQLEKQSVKIPAEALPDYSKTVKNANSSYLSQAAHPGMCILQLIFKSISIASFILLIFIFSWFDANKTFPFVIIVLSAAFDFWSVKNLTGRYLVKLRWWSEIQEDGTELWKFESFEDGVPPNSIDSTFFWFSQTGFLAFWCFAAFINLIGLSPFNFTLCAINVILLGGNFIGYYKCRGAHQKKMKNAISKLGIKMISDAF